MTEAPLQGVGVLVTRPRTQAAGLATAIENRGGKAFRFPVIEIVPRPESRVAAEVAALPLPDIVIFVSPNAVEYGLRYAKDSTIGAIGPATEAAIKASGRVVDISPQIGYDSESLLAEPALSAVAGKHVLIVRGNNGLEHLAESLRNRGAKVSYLSVYNRNLPKIDPQLLAEIEAAWRSGEIGVVTVMSVQSLKNLATVLPDWCASRLGAVVLVTPAARVIKEALQRYPSSKPVLASGPQAAEMVAAIIDIYRTDLEKQHE